MNRLLMTGVVAIAMLVPAITADAQSSQAMEQLYGQGVHAYHSGQMQNATDAFSQAIQLGSRDPRVYYFRGLAQSSLGNSNAATGDFNIGAQMEASSTGRHFAVGRSLERVQGSVRLEIENARRNARLVMRSQAEDARSPGFVDNSKPVIPDPSPAGQVAPMQTNFPDVSGVENPGTPFADSSSTPSPEATPEATPEPQADPFGSGDEAPPVPAEPAPMEEVEEDPFGDPVEDPAPPTEEPMEEDPFGDDGDAESAEDFEEPMAEDPVGDEGAEGAKEAVEEDPFGDEGAEGAEEPMEEDPFGEEGAEEPMEEDPFGDEGAETPKDTETPEGTEEPTEEDPFGEEGEGESPPDDPFGDDGDDGTP